MLGPSLRLLVLSVALLVATPVLAQNPGGQEIDFASDVYQASLKAITILLVLSVLIENALAVIFNWRVFRSYFSVTGIKTIISFAVAFIIVKGFEMDVISSLLAVYAPGDEYPSTLATEILTALTIAGGSSGVNTLMAAFGYRNTQADAETPAPPKDKAWISVRVQKKQAESPVQVHVTEDPRAPADLPAIAGTCLVGRPSLLSLLMRNNDRFPQNGGYTVTPDKAYRISVSATDREGGRISKNVTEEPVKLAAGAIVDFEVEL